MTPPRWWPDADTVPIAALLLVAGGLRVFRVGATDLWLDEAFSYHYVTSRPLSDLLFSLPLVDPHPPLYYVLLHGWVQVAGTSEPALRFPSVVFGTAAVGVFYRLVAAVFDRETGFVAALFAAVSPLFVEYSQEARMYALATVLTIVATYYLYRSLHSPSVRNRVGYVLAAVLLGYTHVWGLFVLCAHVLYVGVISAGYHIDGGSTSPGRWLVTYGAIGGLLSPWLAVLVWRAFFMDLLVLNAYAPPTPNDLLETLVLWVIGRSVVLRNQPFLAFVVLPATALAGAAWFLHATSAVSDRIRTVLTNPRSVGGFAEQIADASGPSGAVFAFLVAVSFAVGVVVSYTMQPIFNLRQTTMVAVGFFPLLARGARLCDRLTVRHLFVVVLLVGLLVPLPEYYGSDSPEPWERVTAEVEQRSDHDDLILITDRYSQVAYSYYADGTSADIRAVAENPERDQAVNPRYRETSLRGVRSLTPAYETVFVVVAHVTSTHKSHLIERIPGSHVLTERLGSPTVQVLIFERSSGDVASRSDRPRNPWRPVCCGRVGSLAR